MANLFEERKAARLREIVDESTLLSRNVYNLVMGGIVLYGLIVNIILCQMVPNIYDIVNPIVFLLVYIALGFGGITLTRISKNPLVSFLGYNMVVVPIGLVVSELVNAYGGIDSTIVQQVFIYTALITGIMVVAATIWPTFFSSLGKVLFISLLAILVGSLLSYFIVGLYSIINLFATVIFSLYIGYDYWRSQEYNSTLDNAVDCALDIYLDIINLFIRLLSILGGKSRKR